MNWVWEQERERKRAVVWGLVGLVKEGVAECGRAALPGQILCPRDLWLCAFFGGRRRRKRLVSNQPAWWRLRVYHIKSETESKVHFLFETTEGRPNVGRWIITLIRLESDNWTPSPLFCWPSYNLATAVKWAEQLITHGWEFCSNKLQCNAWAISNKTALWIFVIFHWALVPKNGFNGGKHLWMAALLMHAVFVLGGRNAHSCFSFH